MRAMRVMLAISTLAGVLGGSFFAAACSGRTHKAIVQQGAPGSSTTTTTGGPAVSPGHSPAIDPNSLGGPVTPAVGTADGTSGAPSGGAGVLPPVIPPSAAPLMTVSTALEDGTPVSIRWDGQSYMGNDKWDLVAQ